MKLFIDDIRNPPDETWILARSSNAAVSILFDNLNIIEEISFDHDLGGDDTAYEVVEFLEEMAHEGHLYKPFAWTVHSQNPVGRERLIAGLLSINRIIAGK